MSYCAVCQPHSAPLCMVYLDTQSDMLHSYRYIDSTVLWSYNTAGVLASLCNLFVLYAMYSIKFEQTLHPQNI